MISIQCNKLINTIYVLNAYAQAQTEAEQLLAEFPCFVCNCKQNELWTNQARTKLARNSVIKAWPDMAGEKAKNSPQAKNTSASS